MPRGLGSAGPRNVASTNRARFTACGTICLAAKGTSGKCSSLHRCLQRHGISRLPDVEGDKPGRGKFKAYPLGYFHIDIAKVRTGQGRLYLFVA